MCFWSYNLLSHSFYYKHLNCAIALCLDYWQKYVGGLIAYSITHVLVTAAVQFQSGSRHVAGVGGLCRSFHETSFRHLGEMARRFPSIPISIT